MSFTPEGGFRIELGTLPGIWLPKATKLQHVVAFSRTWIGEVTYGSTAVVRVLQLTKVAKWRFRPCRGAIFLGI